MTEGARPHRFEALDSLRGVCACMVVLLHFRTPGAIAQSALVTNSFLFVDFFFVLSGFVIAASYGDKLASGFSIGKFMGLRMGRIYPLHAALLLIFVAFELFFLVAAPDAANRRPFTGINSPEMLGASFLLIHPFIGADGTYWNGPSWSIAVEMWTYLVFALLIRFAKPVLMPLCLLIAAACCYYLLHLTDRYLNVFHNGTMARCLYGFALGIVAFRLYTALPRWPAFGIATAWEMMVTLAVTLAVINTGATPWSLVMPPVFLVAVLTFAQQAGAVSRLLLQRPFLLIGTLSFSIYMIHGFLEFRLSNVLQAIEKLSHHELVLTRMVHGHRQIGGSPLFGDFMSIFALALTIGCSWLTYRLIEKPGQRWSRRLVLGDHPRQATVRSEAEAPTF